MTSLRVPSRSAGASFYNKTRDRPSSGSSEGKQATCLARGCRAIDFRGQRSATAGLSVLAYDTWATCGGGMGLPHRIKSWSLTSLQQRLMKTGGRLVAKHARYYWLLLAQGHLNRRLFGDMLSQDLGS